MGTRQTGSEGQSSRHSVKIIEDPSDPDDGEPKSYDLPIWAWVVVSFAAIVAVLAVIVWLDKGT